MLNERLTAIRERAEKATPGPWEASRIYSKISLWYPRLADSDFIAASRTDIPALLDALEIALETIRDAHGYVSPSMQARLKECEAKIDARLRK